jgi:hypothetical protein
LPGYRGFPDKVLPNPIKCLDRLGDWHRFEVATAAGFANRDTARRRGKVEAAGITAKGMMAGANLYG